MTRRTVLAVRRARAEREFGGRVADAGQSVREPVRESVGKGGSGEVKSEVNSERNQRKLAGD